MDLVVTYWKNTEDSPDQFVDITIEFEKHSYSDTLPYGEGMVERSYCEYDVFVYGDCPEEIKEVIRNKFEESKKFYSGTTENFEFTAE